jgi:hexosaminidase
MLRIHFFLLALLIFSCKNLNEATAVKTTDVIPRPVSYKAEDSVFKLGAGTVIVVPNDSDEITRIGQYLADQLNPATGFDIKVSSSKPDDTPFVELSLKGNDAELGDEGYELSVNSDAVSLTANKPSGLFMGIQTILQLLPAKINMASKQEGEWQIAGGVIRDFPTYAFRGSMLDVSRHFFSVEDVKRYIDLISHYKLNVLHLHLSDDQGWRIEIKSWPNLTAKGSTAEVGEGKGGFYTQEQYKDIVAYASDRFITIIPEVDMPGHTNAALASYPELNCNGKAPELYRGIEVGFSTLCTNKELTYKFIDDVVGELAAMTPGPYLHMGGDESHATKHEDYIPFVERVQQIVAKHGKQMIGWEEIAQSKLVPQTIVQYWSNVKHAEDAARKGAKIIMSPAKRLYLDMKYDSTTKIGQDWAARIEIDSSYSWNPATLVPGITKENILGVEAPLWTETIKNMDDIEYMIFPRLAGIAELAWSRGEGLNWEEYRMRLAKHGARFKAMGIDYYQSKQVPWSE